MTDIVERLRRRYFSPVAVFRNPDGPEAADEIERLRAALLETEMKAEIADLEDVGRLIAIGRRQGIEAALEVVRKWPPHMVVTTIQAMLEDKP